MTLRFQTSAVVSFGWAIFFSFICMRCAFLREAIGFELRRPKLSLADVLIEKFSMQEIELAISIRVFNPNDFTLDFEKVTYVVKIDGHDLAHGVHEHKIKLPAESHVLVKLPLSMNTDQALALLSNLFTSREEMTAQVAVTADFLTPLGALTVQFDEQKPLRKMTGF